VRCSRAACTGAIQNIVGQLQESNNYTAYGYQNAAALLPVFTDPNSSISIPNVVVPPLIDPDLLPPLLGLDSSSTPASSAPAGPNYGIAPRHRRMKQS
jgi:hypothetical protein